MNNLLLMNISQSLQNAPQYLNLLLLIIESSVYVLPQVYPVTQLHRDVKNLKRKYLHPSHHRSRLRRVPLTQTVLTNTRLLRHRHLLTSALKSNITVLVVLKNYSTVFDNLTLKTHLAPLRL